MRYIFIYVVRQLRVKLLPKTYRQRHFNQCRYYMNVMLDTKVQGVHFNVSLITAAQSHKKAVSSGTLRPNCRVH